MKKIIALVLAIVVALLGAVIIAGNAGAATPFKSYHVTQTWYKAGGTLDDIWPQSTTEITCGGISQTDNYVIDSYSLDKQYKALIAGGVLTGSGQDAPFSPSNYFVSLLPTCLVSVPVPADLSPVAPGCGVDGSLNIPANTSSVKYTVDGVKVGNGEGFTEGPGTYVVVYHVTAGNILANGDTSETQTITVLPALENQSTAYDQACFVRPPVPTAIYVTEHRTLCNPDGVQNRVVSQSYSWSDETHDYVLGAKYYSVWFTVRQNTPAEETALLCNIATPTHNPIGIPVPVKRPTVAPTTKPVSTPSPTKAVAVVVASASPSHTDTVPVALQPVADSSLASTGATPMTALYLGLGLLLIGMMFFGLGRLRHGTDNE